MSESTGTTADPVEFGSKLSDADLALRCADFVRRGRNHSSPFRQETKTAYAFVAGDQWDAADVEALRKDERPAVTFNRVGPMVMAVSGAEINNRQDIKFHPRGMSDPGAAEVATLAVRWARQQAEMEDEESHAFLDAMICGMGWTETRMDYGDRAEGMIVAERFDPDEALWDPASRKRNLSDARELARVRQWRLDDAIAEWPEHADALRVARASLEPGGDVSSFQARRPFEETGDSNPEREARVPLIEIAHYQWAEARPVVVFDDNGQRGEMTPAEWAKASKIAEALGRPIPDHTRVRRRVWCHAFVAGNLVLERGDVPGGAGPTLRCITGMLDRNSGLFYGLVRAMIDPQRWANKWLAQAMHYVASNGRGGAFVEEDAIPDQRAFESTFAKPSALTVVAPGALGRGAIRPKDPPVFPQGFDRLLQFAIAAIPDVTGINREMLGLADRDQAGILEAQRRQAAQAILAPLFDSLRRYRKGHGLLVLGFVREFVPPQDILRVMDDEGTAQFVQAAMIPDATVFDVIVDEAPTSPNQKTEVWQTLVPMLPALMKMAPPPAVWTTLLKFSPLPNSAVQELRKALEAPAQEGPPPEVEKAQAELQMDAAKTAADVRSIEAKTAAQVEATRIKAETQREIAMQRQQDQQMRAWQQMLNRGGIQTILN